MTKEIPPTLTKGADDDIPESLLDILKGMSESKLVETKPTATEMLAVILMEMAEDIAGGNRSRTVRAREYAATHRRRARQAAPQP
jgi:hypothetical protein